MRLERHIVVQSALELLNRVGLDGLTTRRLAEELGVQGPALYWHFRNKQELIDEMARSLLHDAYGPILPGQDWGDWLGDGARRLRHGLLSYRDSARLLAGYRPSGPHGKLDPAVVFAPLKQAGFGMPDALWVMMSVSRFTFGWTMDEQAARGRPLPPNLPPLDPDAGFEFGLTTIIAGLRARLAGAPEPRAACHGPAAAAGADDHSLAGVDHGRRDG